MCCIELFLKVNRFVLFSGVDEISSLRVQGAQADRTAQRYLTLNSREKRVKKTRICVQFFQTHGKNARERSLLVCLKRSFVSYFV